MMGESPTRPGRLLVMPPVEVAAARLPAPSRATAPTVPWVVGGTMLRDALAALLGQQLLQALGGAEVEVGHERQALLEREFLRPRPHQQHVARLLHDVARQVDGVADVAHRGDRARRASAGRP